MFRRIYGSVKKKERRLSTNDEVIELLEELDLVTRMKIGKKRLSGHVQRMEEGKGPRKVL